MMGLDTAQISILLASNMLLSGVLQAPFGRFADRFDRQKMIIIGLLVDIAFMFLIPHMRSFTQLLALCLVMSLAKPLSVPASSAMAVVEGEKVGMGAFMGLFNMAMSIGMAVGPLLGGLLYDYLDLRATFYFAAAVVVIVLGLFVFFHRKPD